MEPCMSGIHKTICNYHFVLVETVSDIWSVSWLYGLWLYTFKGVCSSGNPRWERHLVGTEVLGKCISAAEAFLGVLDLLKGNLGVFLAYFNLI